MPDEAKLCDPVSHVGASYGDAALLRRYVARGDQSAFGEIVRRRLNLVYSVALRQVGGDVHLAQDVVQAVFTALARKAPALVARPVLSGWLYRSAQFAASDVVRAERRRRAREGETMHEMPVGADADWERLRPLLDEVMTELRDDDRDAVALRFFEQRGFAEIGATLRLTDDAARKRVERALAQLHAALARRGIKSTAAALGLALANQAAVAAPASWAATVTATALAGAAKTTLGTLGIFMGITKLQVGIAGAVVIVAATGYLLQAKTNAGLRREIAALRVQQTAVSSLRTENQRLATAAAEVEMLRRDDAELKQLAQDVAATSKLVAAQSRSAQARAGEQAAQAEIDRMNREGNALVLEYRALVERSRDPKLTPEERAAADAAAKQKLAAIQQKQREVQAFTQNARSTYPDLPARSAYVRRAESGDGPAGMPGTISARRPESADGQPGGWTRAPAADERVMMNLPSADIDTAFGALQVYTGQKILRDPSIANLQGTINIPEVRCTKLEAIELLKSALAKLNIVLEPAGEGVLIAKPGPPR
jgi:RNA polymerase sigma factor (sigma-70 family)